MAAKKKAKKKKKSWGGKRPGAGRPKGSGNGPSPHARTHRIAVMFDLEDVEKIRRIAWNKDIPVAKLVWEMTQSSLKGMR